MALHFFVKGAILGFAIAAPVGPIGILCLRKTLQFGRFSGLFSGLGAAVADTIYGLIAAFGLTFISDFFLTQQLWLRFFGGGFLFYLGARTFFAKALPFTPPRVMHKTLWADFFSTLFLTLSSPMTIFSFLAVFAGFGLISAKENYTDATWLVSGIFCGSTLWWLILSEGVTYFRHRVSQKIMTGINRCAGLLIIGFGLFSWFSLLHLQSPS